jgi:hypothetical protein
VAIDYMIMPLSRYIAGDFVTPQMERAWKIGISYKQVRAAGVRDFPPGVPVGGVDAAHRRADVAVAVRELFAPVFDPLPWDEASDAARFHRVDRDARAAFQDHVVASCKPSLVDRLRGRSKAPVGIGHVFGTIFVPAEIADVFEIEEPICGIVTSATTALRCLDLPCDAELALARDTLRAALHDAVALGLPMIVDA